MAAAMESGSVHVHPEWLSGATLGRLREATRALAASQAPALEESTDDPFLTAPSLVATLETRLATPLSSCFPLGCRTHSFHPKRPPAVTSIHPIRPS